MEQSISQLLTSYENGKVTRRALVQGLALLAVGASTASAAGLQGSSINHVGLAVSDLQRSVDFYQKIFGVVPVKRESTISLSFGTNRLVLRQDKQAGMVDHFAIGVDDFSEAAAIEELKARGAAPYKFGRELRIKDPDGFPVQVMEKAGSISDRFR